MGILFKPAHHLNGKHVVFGEIVEGHATLDAIEGVKTQSDDRPIAPIVIARCGQLERRVIGVKRVKRKREKPEASESSEDESGRDSSSSSSDKKKKKEKGQKRQQERQEER